MINAACSVREVPLQAPLNGITKVYRARVTAGYGETIYVASLTFTSLDNAVSFVSENFAYACTMNEKGLISKGFSRDDW